MSNHSDTLTPADAAALARALYGIAASATPLPGEYDANFRLESEGGAAHILKVMHPDSARATLELQVALLEHLAHADPQLTLPRVIPTLAGERIASAGGRMVWLLSYVPGRVLAEARPHSPELLESLGAYLGRLDAALLGFAHPAARRELKWDLVRAGWIAGHLDAIADERRRALVAGVLARYQEQVAPALGELRAGVIHNDANDYNVLVSGAREWPQRVESVIDFGDALEAPLVCELAIAAAYALLGKPDPLGAIAQVAAGYHRALPLAEGELALLFDLVCMRLAVSVTNSAIRKREAPDDPYVTISEAPAWEALERLAAIHPRLAHYRLRQACGLPPSPHGPRVAGWLATQRCAPVLGRDLARESLTHLDLSVGSLMLGADPANVELGPLTEAVFGAMRADGARVGFGGYGEARGIYTAAAFATGEHPTNERRTIHLGVDLWVEAGTPVFAPLDGTVHIVADNAERLDYGPLVVLEHSLLLATEATERIEGSRRGASEHAAATEGVPSSAISVPSVAERLTFYTLYGHLSADRPGRLEEGARVAAGELIGFVGAPPVNGDWPPHVHVQVILDLLDLGRDYPGVALASQRDLWLGLSPDANLLLKIPPERYSPPAPTADETLRERRARIGRNLSISYRRPLKMVRGWMQYLYDDGGRAYLDVYNNVPHVGHSHPRVVRAAQRQLALLNTNTRYLHDNIVRYAERLSGLMPEPLSVCFFVNSASEANELALRLARAHTGQRDMIVLDAAYHGHTTGLIDISPYKFDGPGGSGAPEWVHVAAIPDDYRGAYRRGDPAAGAKYARDVAALVQDVLSTRGGLAGYIAESLPSVGGQIVLPPGYLAGVYNAVRAAGGVCIADEVQVGFGRLGSSMWGFELQGVTPDIVVLGKPIGNSFPLGAVVTTPAIADAFDNGMEFFSTFGGNPVACAVGLAVLDVVRDEGLQERAARVGGRLLAGLKGLVERHPIVGDARGSGLFLGLELVRDRITLEPADAEASYVVNRLRDRCVLAGTDGPYHNVIKIRPPLPFSEADADFLVQTLDEILAEDFVRR